MNDHENRTVESKCRFLRQQLFALGYENEFSLDSLPLLENLVSDVLQTTDTLKHYKDLSQNCLQACHDLETFVDSYKKDNAWLVQELNALNLNFVLEKTAYEKRISNLERSLKNAEVVKTDLPSTSRSRTRFCQKANTERPSSSCSRNELSGCKSLKEKCNQYEDIIKDKDTEIQQLYSEIFRLNNLFTDGRPVESVLKGSNEEHGSNELFQMRQRNAELQQNLNDAIISQHEAKRHAVKLAGRCQHQNSCACDSNDWQGPKNIKDKTDASKEKLKQIEEELNNLKLKYQKLELVNRSPDEVLTESSKNKLSSEVISLKESCKKLEKEKVELLKELNEIKSAHEDSKHLKMKVDKELSELKRSYEESETDRKEKEKTLKKCFDNKRLLTNRVQELSIIERDLTLEITRLCNINAVHKRHILDLETKLLEVYQRKGKENLASELNLQITKKPLEKRGTKTSAAVKTTKLLKNKESDDYSTIGKISDSKPLSIVSQIREKYNKQIDIIQEEQRNVDLSEFNLGLGTSNLKPEVVSFTEELKLLNNKVDSLKNCLLEKEKLISNLVTEKQELNLTLNEVTSNMRKTHDCDHCKLAEKMIADYKEKLLKLEIEKRELQQNEDDYRRTIDCNNQHITQLRKEMHELQMELQQHKTDSNRFSKLEEETNLSVESSKVLQKQLEVQLESTLKKLQLMEKETSNARSELLSLRDENLKLQRSIMDLESQKEKLASLSSEKSKKLNTLEKTLKLKECRLSSLENVIDDFKKQISTQTDTRKSTNVEHLRMQIRNLEKARDQAITENKQLKRDLNSLTQDYLSCKKELDNAKKETQDLNVQVHDYIAKVRSAEETLQQKDKERSEMLEHFRSLTVEATQLGNNNMTLESEARSTRTSLRNAESKVADLENVIQNKDGLIASYLEQIDVLTKNIARLETQVSNLTDQRDRLQAELDSCELLCDRMEKHGDTPPTVKSSGRKLGDELYRLHAENERLQKNLYREKSNVTTLEHLLSESRDGMEHSISVSELQDEIRGLKANIKCLQEALESTNRQLRHTQSEASDYQKQIIHLNCELRNLQFENIRNATDHSINYSTL